MSYPIGTFIRVKSDYPGRHAGKDGKVDKDYGEGFLSLTFGVDRDGVDQCLASAGSELWTTEELDLSTVLNPAVDLMSTPPVSKALAIIPVPPSVDIDKIRATRALAPAAPEGQVAFVSNNFLRCKTSRGMVITERGTAGDETFIIVHTTQGDILLSEEAALGLCLMLGRQLGVDEKVYGQYYRKWFEPPTAPDATLVDDGEDEETRGIAETFPIAPTPVRKNREPVLPYRAAADVPDARRSAAIAALPDDCIGAFKVHDQHMPNVLLVDFEQEPDWSNFIDKHEAKFMTPNLEPVTP